MIGSVEAVARLVLASAAGSVIGYERERLQWAAGLRTHMLVCVGSCLIVIVSAHGFDGVLGDHVVLDPSRIAAQVVSGIGFLGAGTILLRGEIVKGLTTAASLWAVAAIGLAVGTGLYVAACATTVLVLVILIWVKPLEERVRARSQVRRIAIQAKRGSMTMATLNDAIGAKAARVKQFILEQDAANDIDAIEVTFSRLPSEALTEVVDTLRRLPFVVSATLT